MKIVKAKDEVSQEMIELYKDKVDNIISFITKHSEACRDNSRHSDLRYAVEGLEPIQEDILHISFLDMDNYKLYTKLERYYNAETWELIDNLANCLREITDAEIQLYDTLTMNDWSNSDTEQNSK